jgi:hypothetical protein
MGCLCRLQEYRLQPKPIEHKEEGAKEEKGKRENNHWNYCSNSDLDFGRPYWSRHRDSPKEAKR